MEEITKNLTMDEKLDLVLIELADVKARVLKLEAFAEERSRDTKPMLGQIHKDIADTRLEMRERFEQVDQRFDKADEKLEVATQYAKDAYRWSRMLHDDLLRAKLDVERLRDHVHDLERQRPEVA